MPLRTIASVVSSLLIALFWRVNNLENQLDD
jgi:hypothetical protein